LVLTRPPCRVGASNQSSSRIDKHIVRARCVQSVCVFHHVCKTFDGIDVLSDVELCINSEEILAIIGPSGCGKSTLLRLAGGLELPTSGAVRSGSAGDQVTAHFVFQEPALLPWRTVTGNVSLALEHTGISPRERETRVTDVLRKVGLSEFADWYPRTLSGGMLQRTSIARAIVARPTMLLMDEPLASLDEFTRDRLIADLVRLWMLGRFTCVYVTHSPSEAVRLAHRVVLLTERPGRVREIIPIDVPIDERSESHPTIVATRDRIWELIRNPG
jgi:NitT/TauT family transport system ATP-binding protein